MVKLIDILQKDAGCTACKKPTKKTLVEAFDNATIEKYAKKFKEEADDLGRDISIDQLKSYIKLFDKVKESLPGEQKKLENWAFPEFVRFVTRTAAGKRHEEPKEIDITPDVVYHNDDDTIVIYNGSKEGNCLKFGKGEKWCITRGSYASYRFNEQQPTFYLAKNNNLRDSDRLSFVAIQVLNPQVFNDTRRYRYTGRENMKDYPPMSYEDLLKEVPWLREVPNLKSILKYIPHTEEEKYADTFKKRPASYKEWTALPYKYKEQYLVSRKDSTQKFSDISDEQFISKYLNKFPDIRNFVAITPGIFKTADLLQNLGDLSDSARRSIISNLGDGLSAVELESSKIPFDVKKLLVKLKKWKLSPNEALYITKDGNTIVKLTIDNNGINMGLYQADDDFPKVKVNKRTSKYLIDYPELDKIPFSYLYELTRDGVIDSDVIEKVIEDVKNDPSSEIAVEEREDGTYVMDAKTLNAFKIKDKKFEEIPFDSEQVQNIFKSSLDSDEFKKNALDIFVRADRNNLPKTTNVQTLASIINSLPYSERKVKVKNQISNTPKESIAFADTSTSVPVFFFMDPDFKILKNLIAPVISYEGTQRDVMGGLKTSQYSLFSDYLRDRGIELGDSDLKNLISKNTYITPQLVNFFNSNPPLKPTNVYKPIVNGDTLYLLNTTNRADSYKINPATRNFIRATLSQANYNQLLGNQPQAAIPQAQARWQQPAPVGNVNIAQTMQNLNALPQFQRIPDRDRRRLNIANGAPLNVATDGGARRRNQLLGNAGRVTQAYAALTSRIYVIRLANGTDIISIKVYPGNREYLLIPGRRAYQVNEPAQLLNLLVQNNLAEARKYFVRTYLDTNPKNLEEVKEILRKHLNK